VSETQTDQYDHEKTTPRLRETVRLLREAGFEAHSSPRHKPHDPLFVIINLDSEVDIRTQCADIKKTLTEVGLTDEQLNGAFECSFCMVSGNGYVKIRKIDDLSFPHRRIANAAP
jgi:hypothetical protein